MLVITMLLVPLAGCGSKNDNSADAAASANPTETAGTDNPSEEPVNDTSADNTAFSYSEGIDENGFFEGITALDYVEIFDYKALTIPSDLHQISEDKLQAEIDNILTYYSTKEQVTNRAVVDGDTVNIDYVGSTGGVEFDGGSTAGAGTDVTIGVTSYIDDFLEQLIGHMPGETLNVEVTFPDVYQNESLQGKDAVFVTTINYIVETEQPELTDDFVETNLTASYGWKTAAEMKEDISAELKETAIQPFISEYMTNEVTISSVPDKLTEYQEKAMLQYYRDGAEYYSMEFEEFISVMGVSSVDELIESNRDSYLQSAKYTLVAQAVAEDADISVSEDDMVGYFNDYSQYEEKYGLPYLKQIVLFQKVISYIIDNATLE